MKSRNVILCCDESAAQNGVSKAVDISDKKVIKIEKLSDLDTDEIKKIIAENPDCVIIMEDICKKMKVINEPFVLKDTHTSLIENDNVYQKRKYKESGIVPMLDGKVMPIVRENKKVQRNDPCPCNSGKKYKHCCMK